MRLKYHPKLTFLRLLSCAFSITHIVEFIAVKLTLKRRDTYGSYKVASRLVDVWAWSMIL